MSHLPGRGPVPEGFQSVFIPGPLPGLNEILDAQARGRRVYVKNRWVRMSRYAAMKKKWGGTVALLAQTAGWVFMEEDYFAYMFVEPNRRRDPSNFVGGGVKLVEDGLQESGLLANDGWKHVAGIQVGWVVGEQPGIRLVVGSRPMTATEMENLK